MQFNEKSPEIPLSRLWEFGDGETSEEKNPFHCFRFPGSYTISLADTFPDGTEKEVKENYITAHAVPKPSFTMFPPHGDAPLMVKFTDTTIDYSERGAGVLETEHQGQRRLLNTGLMSRGIIM